MNATLRSRARLAGFTLVEIMIGLLIGVIGIVVIMQVFAVSEGYKRTATSGTDAQVNGSIALYLLEREIRLAGYGMNSLVNTGCTSVVVWNNSSGTSASLRMVPFEINPAGIPAGDAGSDVILVAYGTSDSFVSGVPANQPSGSSSNFKISQNREGFNNGDLVIGVQPGGGPGGATSCAMHELTGVPGTHGNCGTAPAGQSDVLNHSTGQYKNPNNDCKMTTPTWNKSGSMSDPAGNPIPALSSAGGGQLFNLGALPQIKVYAIRSGNLTSCDMLNSDCTDAANYEVMVNDIVSMRALYGKDTAGAPVAGSSLPGDGKVETWSRAALATGDDVSRTLAAAIEITSRSALKEKPSSGTTCDTTADATRPDKGDNMDWYEPYKAGSDGTIDGAQIDLTAAGTDWKCYRYKLFQTSIPLRNMIWRP